MDDQKALRALRLFNEKADKLDSLSFTRQVFSETIGVRLKIGGGQMQWTRQGPDAESIDAFCLTIRLFVQSKDTFSFGSLSKVYKYLANAGIIDKTLADAYEHARGHLAVLHEPIPQTPVIFEGHAYTPWEVFETILYGKLAHSDEEKERLYQRWVAVPMISPILGHWFVRTLAAFVKVIDLIRPLNEEAIEATLFNMHPKSSVPA